MYHTCSAAPHTCHINHAYHTYIHTHSIPQHTTTHMLHSPQIHAESARSAHRLHNIHILHTLTTYAHSTDVPRICSTPTPCIIPTCIVSCAHSTCTHHIPVHCYRSVTPLPLHVPQMLCPSPSLFSLMLPLGHHINESKVGGSHLDGKRNGRVFKCFRRD